MIYSLIGVYDYFCISGSHKYKTSSGLIDFAVNMPDGSGLSWMVFACEHLVRCGGKGDIDWHELVLWGRWLQCLQHVLDCNTWISQRNEWIGGVKVVV